MEGRLGRILEKVRGTDKSNTPSETKIRTEEISRTLKLNADRHNSARVRLQEKGLSEDALGDINIAVRAGMALQKAEDDIYWRAALIERGLSEAAINKIHTRKEAIELEVETSAPRFSTDVHDNVS